MKSTVKLTAYTVLLELFGPSRTSALGCDLHHLTTSSSCCWLFLPM